MSDRFPKNISKDFLRGTNKMKWAAGIVIFVLLAAIGFGLVFFLLLALNGFSESDATPAMIFYFVWMILCAFVMGVAGIFLTKLLLAKSVNSILALVISVVLLTGIGGVIDFGGLIVSTIIATEVRDYNLKN